MAISLVQTVAPTAGTGNIAASLTATGVGDLLVIVASTGNESSNFISSITDGSNSYAQATKSTANSGLEIWYGVQGVSKTSVTINFSGSSLNHVVYVREYSGLSLTPLDRALSSTGSGTSLASTGSAVTSYPSELVVVAATEGSTTATFTAGSGYGNLVQRSDATSLITLAIEDQIISSTGSQIGTMTSSVNTAYTISVATFAGVSQSLSDAGANYLYPRHVIVGNGISSSEVAN